MSIVNDVFYFRNYKILITLNILIKDIISINLNNIKMNKLIIDELIFSKCLKEIIEGQFIYFIQSSYLGLFLDLLVK